MAKATAAVQSKQMTIEELDQQMAEIQQKRQQLLAERLQPMKDEYEELQEKLEKLAEQIQSADPNWSANPRRTDLVIDDAMREHLAELPVTAEIIQAWVKDDSRCTLAKVQDILKKGSSGTRNRFVEKEGKYDLKNR